jgi:hypothetical protein
VNIENILYLQWFLSCQRFWKVTRAAMRRRREVGAGNIAYYNIA